jgi:hypothetical protein
MQYPSGRKVQIGDVIWINEGSQQGEVTRVIESNSDFQIWGLNEPGIFVQFTTSERSGEIFIFEHHFREEGIELIDE